MGWGTGPWGTTTWGLGVVSDFSVAAAYAVATRTVRVVLTSPPLFGSPATVGDAERPSSWAVYRADGTALTVLSATRVDDTTVAVRVLEHFPAYPQVLTVVAVGLRSASSAVIGTPSSAAFTGVAQSRPAGEPHVLRDLRNPAFDTTTQPGGTLKVSSAGDYELHSGDEFLIKMIYRRLSTQRGSFFHLPEYGLGLRTKEPLTTQDLTKLRAEVERQLALEDELVSAQVRLTFNPTDGILSIYVLARTNTNESVEATVRLPTVS